MFAYPFFALTRQQLKTENNKLNIYTQYLMKSTFETIWLFFHRPVRLVELLILYARVQFYTPRASDYRLISKTAERLSSSNFHRIQMHLNRPILYIGLIVKYKTILILKSKNLTCGLCDELIIKSKSSIIDILVSYVLYHTRWQKGIKSETKVPVQYARKVWKRWPVKIGNCP